VGPIALTRPIDGNRHGLADTVDVVTSPWCACASVAGSQPRLALDPQTLGLLAEHRERVIERCAKLGCELSPDAYLFSLSPDGSTPYKPRTISQRYRRVAKAQGLRSTRFHALRH
jgi:integrase